MEKHVDKEQAKTMPLKVTFKNILRWTIHELCDFDLSWNVVVPWCVLEGVVFTYTSYIHALLLGLLLFYLRYQLRIRKNDVLSDTKEMFSRDVLAVNPGLDTAKWNEVAAKMNNELYEQHYWRSRQFFFDEDECHRSFREYILKPSSTPLSDASSEAVKLYNEATNELYKNFLQDVFPSNTKSLPGNERYGRTMWLISNKSFLKHALPELGILASSLASGKLSPTGIFLCYICAIRIHNAYKSHLEGKYKSLGITQRVRFLAAVMHFAPGDDPKKWDHIAAHMNWYLRIKGTWTDSHENFFNGKECLDFYESQFMLLPLKPDNFGYPDLKEIVNETNKVCAPL